MKTQTNSIKNLSLQYITNQKGEKVAVILPIEEFEELLMDLEDLKDINERKNETTIDHQDLIRELTEDGIL
ncbi:MAG: hypothetical protein QNJ42_11010 [Crocosphaera sp.]|nr:hypothetical protein [Crocosphaera sp.]